MAPLTGILGLYPVGTDGVAGVLLFPNKPHRVGLIRYITPPPIRIIMASLSDLLICPSFQFFNLHLIPVNLSDIAK
jgi:hypothetical protein